MTQLRCCDCGEPFPGLTEHDADEDCPGSHRDAQCERCHRFEGLQAQFTYRSHDEDEP